MKVDIDFKKLESNLISLLEKDSIQSDLNSSLTVSEYIELNSKMITAALRIYHAELENKLNFKDVE